MNEYSIGVDLGGTNLRAAAVDREGRVLEKISVDTNFEGGREAVIGDIVDGVNRLKSSLTTLRLAGVGIGVPGFILLKQGFITNSNNLPYLENYPVRDAIEQKLGTPIILENDANAAALGEKWMGAGREVDDLVLLTLGTGIGGGIITDGRVQHGMDGMAGELGHLTIDPFGPPCGCGNWGCLEKLASATAVESAAMLMSLSAHPLTSKEVYELAMDGDKKAQAIFTQMGRALGIGLATLINTFNYPLYLLSGGMLPAWNLFWPELEAQVKMRSFTYRNSKTRIEAATLGNQAGLIGAAYLPFQATDLSH
ncbi:MAG TPA: ROK family protein [Bryobacteraceae bacterium]|nr:ROK family protein [Bryobacteraceae bacterium]